jgi:NAD-dependent dihydropyrimidine dehydrogenase PreA subunit/flavodoxin
MKGILFYHSNSGNTRLTCDYLQHKLQAIDLTRHDIAVEPLPDLDYFEIIGFATWTYFLGLPPFFQQFLANLPAQTGKPTFALNTFGMMSGQALKQLTNQLREKGFNVLAAHSFHTPESYPPYIIKEWDSVDAPEPKELDAFHQFVAELDGKLTDLKNGTVPSKAKVKIGLFNHLMRPYSLEKARKQMGALFVDEALCTECGICQDVCLYQAIDMNPMVVINADNCHACWACFNHCPDQAIFTEKIREEGQYPEPITQFADKLSY